MNWIIYLFRNYIFVNLLIYLNKLFFIKFFLLVYLRVCIFGGGKGKRRKDSFIKKKYQLV